MIETILVRPYDPRDRAAVRHICCETADAGRPMESFFRDREFIADLVTRYYTDFEAGQSWVAERAGQVVGYLTGCLDTNRQRRVTGGRILPGALARALGRGVLFQCESWRLLAAFARTAVRHGLPPAPPLERFPAHVHLNLLPAARGNHAGRELMLQFFAKATRAGVPGIHASVRADNESGCRFFERMGFVELRRSPMRLPVGGKVMATAAILYGKTL